MINVPIHPELPPDWHVEMGRSDIAGALSGRYGETQEAIAQIGLQLISLLIQKNTEYGDSAINPNRIFAQQVSALDQLHIRMDDKLNRVMKGDRVREDSVFDLAGYCILEIVCRLFNDLLTWSQPSV